MTTSSSMRVKPNRHPARIFELSFMINTSNRQNEQDTNWSQSKITYIIYLIHKDRLINDFR